MSIYTTSSPVLFIIFNRPDTTERVFDKIKEAKPKKLYIAADGPRKDKIQEAELCSAARSVIDKIDWPCEVLTLFRENNLGCKYAVSSAITWFFDHEQQGIILEDDCLPSNDFFRFCDEMLDRYKNDSRIRHITGCNLQDGRKWGDATYYFSNNVHVWGWAGWKRVWDEYDVELKEYKEEEVGEQLAKIFDEKLLVESWKSVFVELKKGNIDTWDYQVGFKSFFNNGLCIIPNYNLISNIGFRPDGTHTFDPENRNSNIPFDKLPVTIIHPKYFLPQKAADQFTWNHDFDIERRKKKERKRRIKRFFGLK